MTRISESVSVRLAAAVWLASVAAPAFAQTVTLTPAPAGVQVTTEYGIEFATVNAVNAPPIPFNPIFPSSPLAGQGAGLAPFRVSRTEVTNAQWLAFANMFIPDGDPFGLAVVYNLSTYVESDGQGHPIRMGTDESLPIPGSRMAAVGISYLNALRYCNWLHNGQQSTIASTMSGAYDLTGVTSEHPLPGTVTRSPGARFWIPSATEWAAAAYYQPGLGVGQGEWNAFPTGSSTQSVPGIPGTAGAQTSAGLGGTALFNAFGVVASPAGAYPGVQSPWGLFDTSGGITEMTDTPQYAGALSVLLMGSGWYQDNGIWLPHDILGSVDTFNGYASQLIGLRIAAAVPGPGAWLVSPLLLLCTGRKRR